MPCPHARLLRLLLEHLRCARLLAAASQDWASATFTGMRHALDLAVPAAAAAELARGLDAASFQIPGQVIADLSIARAEPQGGEVVWRVEALTLDAR